jgi:predicted lipoprotein with Yx(FWY)xxD motif
MRRSLPHQLLAAGAAAAATLALAACGGGDDGASSTTTATSTGAVTVRDFDGVGSVLADPTGKPLYTPNEEADGKVRCTGGCTSIWQPLLAPGAGAPKTPDANAALDVIARPDGKRQVTADGKPLYTFSEDAPGQATGDGFSDDFAGRHFTWHAVLATGKASNGSSGAGTSTSSRDGY